MTDVQVEVRWIDSAALAADRGALETGGAFARGARHLDVGTEVVAVLVHPLGGAVLRLPAHVVWCAPDGLGLELRNFDRALRAVIAEFLDRQPQPVASLTPQQRVRNLDVAQQRALARKGDQTERVALERAYGKMVWDSLLQNPRISPPEVALIAHKGSISAPILETIVANPAWLSSPQVRRALLANPKLNGELLMRVLRATPRAELRLMPKQTAYPATVREAASRLLGGKS